MINSGVIQNYKFYTMQNRISEMENEQVDYLRFDRIKIQRKRMEHILEVIKDLSFKNKQLFKENAALKQEHLHESHYEKLYRQLNAERSILIDKNLQMSSELEKYKETVLHQQILINSLKQELYGQNISIYHPNFYETREKQVSNIGQKQIISQQYKILEVQYEDLKKEYGKLYKKLSTKLHSNHKDSPNRSLNKFLCGKQNEKSKVLYTQCKNRQNSASKCIYGKNCQSNFEQEKYLVLKLKEKYDKCKKAKKELSNQVKILRQSLSNYQLRQKRHVQLIEILKQKRTKICLCHVNKLKKIMSQTMFQKTDIPHQSALHN